MVCSLRVVRIICHLWVINHIGEFWSSLRADSVVTGTWGHLTQAVTQHRPVSRPISLPPAQSAMPRSPPIYSINKPGAGPRQRIMVHLEVTGKENRALCITNADRDKHSEALRNLDKGLSKHVRNWIHFLFLSMLEQSFWRSQFCSYCPAEIALLILCFLWSGTKNRSSHISPKRSNPGHYTPSVNSICNLQTFANTSFSQHSH